MYKSLRSLDRQYDVVIARGLDARNVEGSISALVERIGTTDFSIDAEGRLRDGLSGEQYFGNDVLNIEKTKGYIRKAHEILN